MKSTVALLLIGMCCRSELLAADTAPPEAPPPAARCEIAIVSPVSGFAECVKPLGAKVDPPPPRPAPSAEECREHGDLGVEACEHATLDATQGR